MIMAKATLVGTIVSAPRGAGSLPLSVVAILVLLTASWGFQLVTVKVAMGDVAPMVQNFLRSLIATILLTVFLKVRGERILVNDRALVPGLVLGFLFAIEFLLIFEALALTTASRATVFLYTMPFFVALYTRILEPAERLAPLQLVGLAAAFLGVIVALGEGYATPASDYAWLGNLLMVTAAVLWAGSTVFIKRSALKTVSAGRVLWFQLAVTVPVSFIGVLIAGAPWPTQISQTNLAVIAYQGVWVAFVTYVIWFWLVARYSAAVLSGFSFMTPIFGVLFGALVLGEPIGWLLGMALALVAVGVMLVNRTPKVERPHSPT